MDTQIPAALLRTRDQREATEDHLLRRFVAALDRANPPRTGSGRSGAIDCLRPGPEVVERSAVRIARDGRCTVRFTVGLPARGRRILGSAAARLLTEDVPALLRAVQVGDDPALAAHITSVCAQRALRRALPTHGLVAFIADGSILPRVDGVRQQPLPDAIPFESPPSLRVTLPTPTGPVTGLGLPMGVTVLTGGGFHGKSTVLHALQRGHLDHVPGDGREGVVTRSDAVKIRAEDGRAVTGVDIGDFLSTLPGGRSTRPFSTVDASGSTSQAAALVEAIEAGARVLLIDEDTSATNLLVRDPRMSALIDRDPITPLIRRVRQLADQGIGTVIVVGGVADWLGVADHVVAMVDWRPVDVTDRAHALVPERPSPPGPLGTIAPRRPRGRAVDRVRCRDRRVDLDRDPIDLGLVEQVLGSHEAATVGHAVAFLLARANGGRSIRALLDALDAILDDEGIEAVSPWGSPGGTLIRPRRFEIASALNRLRSLHLVDD